MKNKMKLMKTICSFCKQEKAKVVIGRGPGAICVSCLADVSKMANDEMQKEERVEEHLRID